MTETRTATHNGHCQCCGRLQAHTPRGIAKHGYTTEYGFFNGTCSGSDRQPLELDTALCDATIAALGHWADERVAASHGEITEVPVSVRRADKYGRRTTTTEWVDQPTFEAHHAKGYLHGWESAVNQQRASLRHHAASVRARAADLEVLKARIHGQPLIARKVDAPLHRERVQGWKDASVREQDLKAQGKRDVRSRRQQYTQYYTITYRD